MKKPKIKKIIWIIIVIILAFFVLNLIGVPIAYDIALSSDKDINFETTPGIINYEEYKDQYKRSNITYQVQNHNMAGYAYMENDTNYLVVSVHGFRDFADYLMAEDFYFVDNGYNVFSFDLSGCGKSEGSINGFSQSLIDLEGTLNFLNTDSRFKSYKKLLFGFSAGGYAATSILSLTEENIIGTVSVSGYYDAENLIAEKGYEYVNFLSFMGKPLVWVKEHSLFGDYLSIRANDAINNSKIPVFLAHGTRDTLITYKKLDTYSKVEESDRVFKYVKEASHSGILYSNRAIEYQRKVNNDLAKLSDMEKKDYYNTIDDSLYGEINDELFPKIIDFFEYCKTR